MAYGRALLVWLGIIVAESAHGALRMAFLEPVLGSLRARQMAMFFGMAIIFAIAWFTIRWIGARDRATLLRIGLMWVALTVAFEIGLGLGLGLSRERMLSDYNLAEGGLVPLGLVVMALTPLAAYRLRSHS